MHAALRQEFESLKKLASEKDVNLAVIETQLDSVIFISCNKGKKLICLALAEGKIHNTLSCFKVNLKKWQWAENEGFSLEDGIPDDITNQILIKFNTPEEYLS